MPRCQWCRQESQDDNVCDWCKRPLAAGWTPAAAPADRMTFAAKDEEPSSDRLLMFSMLGIVAVVGLAFAVSFFGRRQALPAVQPVAAPIEQPQPIAQNPPAFVNNGPVPAPLMPMPEPQNYAPGPVYNPPAYVPAPQPVHRNTTIRRTGNRKLDGLAGAAADLG